MLFANDQNRNRVSAKKANKKTDYFCPVCSEKLKYKAGKVRRPHFAHVSDSNCAFDKDYKSEWHIRMQEYFPEESLEVRFIDNKTGDIHIADVFLKEYNTAIEFQHSPISWDEFWGRTIFHITNGHRIVWCFDESSSSKKNFGKFRKDEFRLERWQPYEDRCYKWLNKPRNFLASPPNGLYPLSNPFLGYISICVCTGTEGDVFHRVINQHHGYEHVTFSLHDIHMNQGLHPDEFFYPEEYWQNQEPWKTTFADIITKEIQYRNEERLRGFIESLPTFYLPRKTRRRL